MFRSLTIISTVFLTFAHSSAQARTAKSEKSWQTSIFRELEELYRPVARANGKNLHIRSVSNDSSAAEAKIEGKTLQVTINSGLLSRPNLTPDGLRMVICHELGHIFGGAPRKSIPPEWDGAIANDGRSFFPARGKPITTHRRHAFTASFAEAIIAKPSSVSRRPSARSANAMDDSEQTRKNL